MKRIAVIPAKGTSRRLPGKNIRLFYGKPILAYSIEAANASGCFDAVAVSTDSQETARIATEHGADAIFRPPMLCAQEAGTQQVAAHAARVLAADIVCCIYATAPMLSVVDLHQGWKRLQDNPSAKFAVSVGAYPLRDAAQFYWSRSFSAAHHELYYATTELVVVSEKRICDINTQEDWTRAEHMYAELYPDQIADPANPTKG